MSHQPPPNVIAAARAAQLKTRVPASVSCAQWACESEWGQKCPPSSNNYFGVKDFHGADAVITWTTEEKNGVIEHVQQPFKRYASLDEAFIEHAELLATDHRYAPAMAALPDIPTFVRLMAKVYATDEHYANTIMAVIRGSNFTQYDLTQV